MKIFALTSLLIVSLLCSMSFASVSPKQNLILNLIKTRSSELNDKLKDLEAMYQEGLVTLQDGEPYRLEINELEQFEFIIKNPSSSSYEAVLKDKLTQKLNALKQELNNKQILWNEGLIATKEIENMEEKAALYNYILEYISDQSRFPKIEIAKLNLSVTAILGRFYPIESKFGFRIDPINPARRQFHAGIDFPAYTGTPIKSPLAGRVSKVVNNPLSGGGLQVRIKHASDLQTVYMHLSKITVKQGQELKAGHLIGYVGATGTRVTGPHLHFEIHSKGIPVDPAKFFLDRSQKAKK